MFPTEPQIKQQNLPETPNNGLAVYVHWPWCVKKCPYCDFNAHVNPSRDEKVYFSCILSELDYFLGNMSERSLTSIFFGGGTPSLASPQYIQRVISTLTERLSSCSTNTVAAPTPEVTLEVNPATYRPEMFHEFVAAGITRFSIGVQSLNLDELKFLGRAHDRDEALRTIDMALESGAEVNTDFIYGLPDQNLAQWEQQLTRITALGTHHVSAYQLTIEPQTKFFAEVNKQQWQPLNADQQADFYLATQAVLTQGGLQQYEISNFARPDINGRLLTCKHNLHVWRYGDYLGLGAGAHGRITLPSGKTLRALTASVVQQQGNRQSVPSNRPDNTNSSQDPSVQTIKPISIANRVATRNFKMPETYIQQVQTEKHALYEEIRLSPAEAAQEAILNGLRLPEGVYVLKGDENAQNFLSQAHFEWDEVKRLNQQNLLFIKADATGYQISITPAGQLLLDSILEKICRSAVTTSVYITASI